MKRIWFILLCVVMVAGSAWAGANLGGTYHLTFASLASVSNTASLSTGTYGVADHGLCFANLVGGTGPRTYTLQTSQYSGGPWTNTSAALTLTTTDTDTYAFDFQNRPGNYWRIHGIGGWSITNTTTFECDVWRNGRMN